MAWGSYPKGTSPSLLLRTAAGEQIEVPGGRIASSRGVEYYLEGEYFSAENLPMTVECRMGSSVLKTFYFEPIEGSGGGNANIVKYDNGWPALRPPVGSAVVMWIGGTPEEEPPALTGVDVWLVPEERD